MNHCHSQTKKTIAAARVISNSSLSNRFYRLTLQLDAEDAVPFTHIRPGQFIELDLTHLAIPPFENVPENLRDSSQRQIILRRPFSFSNVDIVSPDQVQLTILYCVLGPATLRMTTLSADDSISILGPLGNGFSIPAEKTRAILVAGGMGAPPLQHLASFINNTSPEINIIAFAGARTAADLPFTVQKSTLQEFALAGTESYIATDDSSLGFHGFVTDCLKQHLEKSTDSPEKSIIYACGPEQMLAQTAKLADSFNIDCQVSMERMMACGIGLCQSCAVKIKSPENETIYKLCCKDGPVFDAKDVIFES